MNPSLYKIICSANSNSRIILGLMSGTSLDGLDMVLCRISGYGTKTRVEVIAFESQQYHQSFKDDIRAVFSKEYVRLPFLTALHKMIAVKHAQLINDFLVNSKIERGDISCIASHGQTIMHIPKHDNRIPWKINATLQICENDHLASLTRLPVIGDFRQKHIAYGGQGAPLAVYGDYCLFSHHSVSRVLINLGGISNFTFLPSGNRFEKVFVTDAGPANTLLDAWTMEKFGYPFDRDGSIAAQGKIHEELLSALKSNEFFTVPFPKSTGPETFHLDFVKSCIEGVEINNIDVLATLTYYSAWALSQAIQSCIHEDNIEVFVSGGGIYNLTLMQHIKDLLNINHIRSTQELGISPDAKEAVLFAILANEFLCSEGKTFVDNPYIPNVTMGKLSLPN